MQYAIIHLSDLHLATQGRGTSRVLNRLDRLFDAVRSALHSNDLPVLVISGDLATFGKAEEYRIAKDVFLRFLEFVRQSFPSGQPTVIVVPGNHDCDLGHHDSLRSLVIEQHRSGRALDTSMITKCRAVLEPFLDFAADLSGNCATGFPKTFAEIVPIGQDVKGPAALLLNTVTFWTRESNAGELSFPLDELPDQADLADRSLVLGIMHHPYNWHSPANARALRTAMEDRCDIILTGHEHETHLYSKQALGGERNLYVEGGVLNDPKDPSHSEFVVLRVDVERKKFTAQTFKWATDHYAPVGAGEEQDFVRHRRSLVQRFVEREETLQSLDDLGLSLVHPRAREVRLPDLFVYPELQRARGDSAGDLGAPLQGQNMVRFILEHKRVLISGDDKSGKTTLAKQLFKDLREAGKIPLLFSSGFRFPARSDRMREAIGAVFEAQYRAPEPYQFWQLPANQRVAIIDDFHLFEAGPEARALLLATVEELFEVVVVFAGPDLQIQQVASPDSGSSALLAYQLLNILELGHLVHFGLVLKWEKLGRHYTVPENQLHDEAVRKDNVLTGLLGKYLVPLTPLHVLLALQQLESGHGVDASSGSYGQLFEAVIKAGVARVSRDAAELDAKLNYLAELAYLLYDRPDHCVQNAEFEAWHQSYCEKYASCFEFRSMVDALLGAGVVALRNGSFSFRYPYYLHFFFARFLAGNLWEGAVRDRVTNLGATLHDDDSSAILMFLCHQSKDPLILDIVLDRSRSVFPGTAEFDVSTGSQLPIGPIPIEPPLTQPRRSPKENVPKMLKAQDKAERLFRKARSVELREAQAHDRAKGEGDAQSEGFRVSREFQIGRRLVRLGGQILRNFYGSLRADRQHEVAAVAYSLGLRSLQAAFEFLRANFQEFIGELRDTLAKRLPKAEQEELNRKASQLASFFADMFVLAMVKDIANSVGLDRLAVTFDRLAKEAPNPSYELIDLCVRLDYFKGFPEQQVFDLHSRFHKCDLMLRQIRYVVWLSFHVYYHDRRTVQSVCQRLGIPATAKALARGRVRGRASHRER